MSNKQSTTSSKSQRPQPEHKVGPLANGIGAAIWINLVDTDNGPKHFRSISIAPRRYFDEESKEWKTASSFNTSDLPALIYALQKVQEYVLTTPLPSQESFASSGDSDSIPY